MIKIQLYWNNICILHRQELVFLDRIRPISDKRGLTSMSAVLVWDIPTICPNT